MRKKWFESIAIQILGNGLVSLSIIILVVSWIDEKKADKIYVDKQDNIIIQAIQRENKITRDSISVATQLLRELK